MVACLVPQVKPSYNTACTEEEAGIRKHTENKGARREYTRLISGRRAGNMVGAKVESVTEYLADLAARFDRAVELGRPREAAFIARQAANLYPDEPGTKTLLDRAARLCGEPGHAFPVTARRRVRRRDLRPLLALGVLVSVVALSWHRAAGPESNRVGLPERSLSRRIPTWQHQPPGHPDHASDVALLSLIHADACTPMCSYPKFNSRGLRKLLSKYGLLRDSVTLSLDGRRMRPASEGAPPAYTAKVW